MAGYVGVGVTLQRFDCRGDFRLTQDSGASQQQQPIFIYLNNLKDRESVNK
jgi:hypothetical protein